MNTRRESLVVLLASLLLCTPEAHSQTQSQPATPSSFTGSVYQAWIAYYNTLGNGRDYASDLAIDGSGNVYVTGYGLDMSTSYDWITIKYDAFGEAQWVARHDGPGSDDDYAEAIVVDGSGNVYVAGESHSGITQDYATIKYDAFGQEQWVARYNGPVNRVDYVSALSIDSSGNVYVTGSGFEVGASVDWATIKYDASGQEHWVATYNGLGNKSDEIAMALDVDGSGNVYVAGYSDALGSFDYKTIKYDSAGQRLWIASYRGLSSDIVSDLAVDGLGNVHVTGYTYSGTSLNYATVKYNPSGEEEWVALYDGPANESDYARVLALDISGNVYVAGQSLGINTYTDYATIKYDHSGQEQWAARYDGPSSSAETLGDIAVDAAGNVYVTGGSFGNVDPYFEAHYDYATIKYDVSGEEEWTVRHEGLGGFDDIATALAVDSSGNVYVTGGNWSGIPLDFATIKYRQVITDVEEGESEIPHRFSLSQSYPNPFNPSTTIDYTLPRISYVKLEVFNLLGERVSILRDGFQDAGYHSVTFEAGGLPSGIFFYRLQAGDFVETRKLVLMR